MNKHYFNRPGDEDESVEGSEETIGTGSETPGAGELID